MCTENGVYAVALFQPERLDSLVVDHLCYSKLVRTRFSLCLNSGPLDMYDGMIDSNDISMRSDHVTTSCVCSLHCACVRVLRAAAVYVRAAVYLFIAGYQRGSFVGNVA